MKDQSQEKAFLETQDIFEMPLAVLLSKYKAYLIEQGGFMTEEDYQRFRQEYKAEADLECLSCAVADAEEEHLKTIETLQADNDQTQELINLQRKRIEQIESENARLREALSQVRDRCIKQPTIYNLITKALQNEE